MVVEAIGADNVLENVNFLLVFIENLLVFALEKMESFEKIDIVKLVKRFKA